MASLKLKQLSLETDVYKFLQLQPSINKKLGYR